MKGICQRCGSSGDLRNMLLGIGLGMDLCMLCAVNRRNELTGWQPGETARHMAETEKRAKWRHTNKAGWAGRSNPDP